MQVEAIIQFGSETQLVAEIPIGLQKKWVTEMLC